MKKAIKNIYISLIMAVVLFPSCESVLDVENLTAINPGDVWNNPEMANAYLTNLYAAVMLPMSMNDGRDTDEAASLYDGAMRVFLAGTATIDSWDTWHYTNIRNINFIFESVDKGNMPDEDKRVIKGQAYFFRAWLYWRMVQGYGGVPLILTPQNQNEDLEVPRSKTSECIAQIIEDLDAAASMLPPVWTTETNRIDQCTALAMKGQVLLWWASPLFNPGDDQQRWANAYNACKAAKDLCETSGKALYKPFSSIWDDEMNCEVIMVRRYEYPHSYYSQTSIWPQLYGIAVGSEGTNDNPTLELVNAFPMKDGSKWTGSGDDYYDVHKNRDDRFYATIAYNGSEPYLKDMIDNGWNLYTYRIKDALTTGADAVTGNLTTSTGFHRKKGVDKTVTSAQVQQCAVDNIIIRFAEVLMNYGEAANGANRPDEALQVLYAIRERAGIEAGDGRYGITATTRSEIFNTYLEERQVEFAFENKRWPDLRRMRRFDILRTMGQRHGLLFRLKPEFETSDMYQFNVNPPIPREANLEDVIDRFTVEIISCDSRTGGLEWNMQPKDEYYFYGIPKAHLDRNRNLQQNQGWDNGTFDPLQ